MPTPSPRLQLARIAAKSASGLSRSLRMGSGTTIGGRVALAVAPGALTGLGRGRVLACVSGTNGKTTTTRLLVAALRRRQPVLSNSSGANLPSGLVGVLSQDLRGAAALEVDELYLATTIAAVAPRVVVLLNLTRDQLDRTAEAQRAAETWRDAMTGPSAPQLVVANCDDPRLVWVAQQAARVTWVAAGQTWTADGQVCPQCGHPLAYRTTTRPVDPGPDWACTGCTLRRPAPDAVVAGDRLHLRGGPVARIRLLLPGRANRSNAAMAALAAAELGVPLEEGLAAMREVAEIEGRYAEYPIAGRNVRLLLAKNPAGWAETMDLVDRDVRPLLLSVNAASVDGRDTSWLYDVPFERMAGREVTVTGAAGADLSLRLTYAGVPHQVVSDALEALQAAGSWAGPSTRLLDTVDAIGDYSSFQGLRRLAATSPTRRATDPASPAA